MPVVYWLAFILNCNTFLMAFTLGTKTMTHKHCTASRNNRQGSKYCTVYSVILFTGKYSKSIKGL